jgi:hypothetical protein
MMKIAITSAKAELYGYRKVARDALRQAGLTPALLDEKWGLKPGQFPDASLVAAVVREVQQCDGLVALLGRDKGLRATKKETGLVEHEIAAAENAGIPVFAYVTPNSGLFARLDRSHETRNDVALLAQSEVVKAVRSTADLAEQLALDLASFFHQGNRGRHAIRLEVVRTIHLPTLAACPEELLRCSPRDFEEVVAELLKADGWNVDVVVRSNASGPDIIACSSRLLDAVPLRMIVECKRVREDRPVDVDVVRKLVYWVNEEYGATLGMIATTSRFTREAKELAEAKHRWRISLRDQGAVREWIRRVAHPTAAQQQHPADGAPRRS